ncbi:purple acid phosphatase 2-like isoform X2 [Prosopis cineraria]|uniref:purple acid phosphatase 2-like isoform X2 n=1 Tax=Prosopis cineraria TaxID=364024 RepID=UPI0024102906|nr:purple acid phosphatase 2-like isoform X2 [Prosopis cineraria]XP_054818521.1 purple acid phosphatase 2-like isoform X2 [Prosopis cineraria]
MDVTWKRKFEGLVVAGFLYSIIVHVSEGGITSSFVRNYDYSLDMPLDSDVFRVPPGYNAPQQVHITQGDHLGKGVIISWITQDEPGSSTVIYWAQDSRLRKQAQGFFLSYKYFNYTSGYIHHCTIENLEFDTKYFYEVGIGFTTRQFWFKTPPPVGPDVPYTFGLIGDLGQTYDSNTTLTHYEKSPAKGETVLYVGDLSYADDYPFHDNIRWDTWGRFTERVAAYQPWIWTAGNHELDFAPELVDVYAKARCNNLIICRCRVKQDHSSLILLVIMFHSKPLIVHLHCGKYTPQYEWLEKEFLKVNRAETPWLIVLMHCPIYSSYVDHYMEGETVRVMYERWFVKYKVDVVFAGHVHAYERSERVSNIAYNIVNGLCKPVNDQSAPVYITIGDGGNLEGLAIAMTEPQPRYSSFREASFGHGILDIKNRSHAYFSWNRNQDGYAVEADSIWLHNRYWTRSDEASLSALRNNKIKQVAEA